MPLQLAGGRDAALAAALVAERQAQAAQLAALRDELAALRTQRCAARAPRGGLFCCNTGSEALKAACQPLDFVTLSRARYNKLQVMRLEEQVMMWW